MAVITDQEASAFIDLINRIATTPEGVAEQELIDGVKASLLRQRVAVEGSDSVVAGAAHIVSSIADQIQIHLIMGATIALSIEDIDSHKAGDKISVYIQEDESTGFDLTFGTGFWNANIAIAADAIVNIEFEAKVTNQSLGTITFLPIAVNVIG